MDKYSGTLKKRVTKKGFEYKVEFINQKGKPQCFVVNPPARHFDEVKAEDGDEAEIEVEGSIIRKCVIAGKEAAPKAQTKKPPIWGDGNHNKGSSGYNQAGGFRGGMHGGGQSRDRQAAPSKCLQNAIAPYNFIAWEPSAIMPPCDDEPRQWSGRLVLNLEAITPLLVSGVQEKHESNATKCGFMQAGGRNVIPGTSIKGMLRSLVEALSFSAMRPVSGKPLFWRDVANQESPYHRLFSNNVILGGFLRQKNATWTLTPVPVEAKDADAPQVAGAFKVKTGGFFRNGKWSASYSFRLPAPNAASVPVPKMVWDNFREQMTISQEGRWKQATANDALKKSPGVPVFYRVDGEGNIAEIGLCRFFRVKYRHTPCELAFKDKEAANAPDFATAIFGSVIGNAFRGRVAVEPAFVEGKPAYGDGVKVVLGNPKPTCLPLYLEQDPAKIDTLKNGSKNKKDKMKNYNDSDARLRGRKMYWHHDADKSLFPLGNNSEKVMSQLYPLAPGAKAQIVIRVDHLTDCELGALLETIELPEGHAHKLGMGKSLGFGSIRLTVERAEIYDAREEYKSLAARLGGSPPKRMEKGERDKLRAKFRARVLDTVKNLNHAWKNVSDYDSLPPIKDLRIMMDYANRPAPAAVATMPLKRFADNAILLGPETVPRP